MAHWVSSRPRDDVGSSRRSKNDDSRSRQGELIWKRRLWLISTAAVLLLIVQSAFLVFRNQDVNALSAAANKKVEALQAERDRLDKSLAKALEENRRLKARLERLKEGDSSGQDRGSEQQNKPRSTPETSPR
jgi:hypothetical protein